MVRIVVGFALVLCAAGVLVAGVQVADAQETIVVDKGGGGDYETIQNAVDNASDGDTVEVLPGVYQNEVSVPGKSITITAPSGATLDGSNSCCDGFDLNGDGTVTISGFLIENWNSGIDADGNDDNWTVTDTEFRNNGRAIEAGQSYGSWSARDNIFRNGDGQNEVRGSGLNADVRGNYWDQATGPTDRQCQDADCGYFLSSPDGSVSIPADRPNPVPVANDGSEPYATINDALVVARDDGSVDTVQVMSGVYRNEVRVPGRDITITAPNGATLNGSNSCCDGFDMRGDGKVNITGFVVENWNSGIDADGNDRNWTVTDTEFRNNGRAIDAGQSYGSWSARDNIFRNGDGQNEVRGSGLNADVRGNYWDQATGPTASVRMPTVATS